eukprot:1430383-Heterocapsa_arctica.AAC.1
MATETASSVDAFPPFAVCPHTSVQLESSVPFTRKASFTVFMSELFFAILFDDVSPVLAVRKRK